jgi:galactose-1-phosphate uridylyltransferase
MNRRRVSREPKGDEEYEESSVLFVDLQQRGGKCAEVKNEKIVQKKSQDQQKRCPLCSSSKYYF